MASLRSLANMHQQSAAQYTKCFRLYFAVSCALEPPAIDSEGMGLLPPLWSETYGCPTATSKTPISISPHNALVAS